MKCDKIRYYGKKQAKKALRQQQKWNAQVHRVYFCNICHCYHLTSSKKPFNNKRKLNSYNKKHALKYEY